MTDPLDLMARTVWGEARGEPFTGKLAVAYVIKNRADHPRWWGSTVEEVCRQHAQFSCWLPGDPNHDKCAAVTPDDLIFVDCLAASRAALQGLIADPTYRSDHYHVKTIKPSWAKGLEPRVAIGAHLFYGLELPAPAGFKGDQR